MVENPDFIVRRAEHVGFSVASLDLALRFWVEGLGGQLVPQVISGGTRAGTKVIYAVGPDGATIEFMQPPESTKITMQIDSGP